MRRGAAAELLGLAGESTWWCAFVQSLLREMELQSHCVNLTKLPVPFLGVDAEGKGEKVHLYWLSRLHLHFFLLLCPFFVKSSHSEPFSHLADTHLICFLS